MASQFIPRAVFPTLDSLPRSYFLGHHRSGLTKMKSMLSSIDLLLECRDYRVPITSTNPLFEATLAGRERVIVYTKKDLGSEEREEDRRVSNLLLRLSNRATRLSPAQAHTPSNLACKVTNIHSSIQREEMIRHFHHPSPVLFSSHKDKASVRKILTLAKSRAAANPSLTGHRMMIVGMPNVGKSSMLNALRLVGVGKGKAAITGGQPGVTRKIGTSVKIVDGSQTENTGREGAEAVGESTDIYLVDTPGVFIPFVPDPASMLKLALCGSVKDTIIPPTTLADYLLFQLNLHDPLLYAKFSPPTNDITVLLTAIAQHTGRLGRGGTPDLEGAALWMIQRWRGGSMGRFVLDDVSKGAWEERRRMAEKLGGSMNSARRADKDARRERGRIRRAGVAQ
ncbi:MAG: hypothetical protein M1819_003990 [Sarea resinae]|nr:MAG: hypothetical protein M1819_003990 [Sarea resinae]